ncbi:hypothetical protein ET445_10910 [Agromyces protaetiae]|uniref:Transglutaminase-like domain-containing protein n=1 Tax=Agromyces protaetiae TaxID=2509455 RepID=A0A4P6FH07_9MICO|nr:DUF3488 and transglutaminase-like domain-containing protein [Agromyces protaetiae]QAY73779.1 hypothetical protein ET445_10910 [Agromyces protaetiae]
MHPEPQLSTPQRALLAGATFLLVVIATGALAPIVSGGGWWLLCAFIAAGVIGAGLALRATRLPRSLVPVLQIVVLFMLLTLVFGEGTGILLVIPTGDTFGQFAQLMEGAARTIQQQSVPAIPVPPLQFALAIGVGAISLVADFFVQVVRHPAFAAVPAFVPIVMPGFFLEDGAEIPVLVLTAAAFLLLLRLDVRARRSSELASTARTVPVRDDADDVVRVSGPKRVPVVSTIGASFGVGAIGIVIAGVLTASMPTLETSQLLGNQGAGTLFSRGVSPFVDLGRDLRRPEAVEAFRYSARDGDRPYFTLLTLDRFEGEVWSATDRPLDGDNTVDRMPRPIGLDREVETKEHPIDVSIGDLRTTWLPVPYPAASIERLRGSWFWEQESLTVRSADTTTDGQRYRVNRLVASPTADQLRAAGRVPAGSEAFDPYLALPDERPQIIRDTAATVAGSAATPYDAAVAIQSYLRGSDFHYSVDAPVEEGYDGGGFGVIAAFLEKGEGYCVHFASTMAVLARELGIPSRISIGYTAGSPTDERIDNVLVVSVDSHDLHAWPELYFEGVGWVPFEPTPGRGVVPEYSRPQSDSSPVVPLPTASTPAQTGRPELDPERGLNLGAGATAEAPTQTWFRAGGLVVLALGIVLGPAMLRAGQGWIRRRRTRTGPGRAEAAWDEVRATARDLGVGGYDAETPRAFAARIAARPAFEGDAGAALAELRNAVERERFGPPGEPPSGSVRLEPHELVDAVAEVRSALASDSSRAARTRAALLPASLFGAARLPAGRRASGA